MNSAQFSSPNQDFQQFAKLLRATPKKHGKFDCSLFTRMTLGLFVIQPVRA
jgi:hypothetical protein